MKICHAFWGESKDSQLSKKLQQAGLHSQEVCAEEMPTAGIIFFDQLTPQLYEVMRAVSHQGSERIIGVALNRAALANGQSWMLLQAGASDVFDWEHSSNPAQEIAAHFERWQEVDEIVNSPLVQNNLAGRNADWLRMLKQIVEVACFTDASVLITGESGTGKELVARLLHTLDRRQDKKNLVTLDCTTIVPELSGSEFFGHERGSFTGAVAARDGAFALANNGTLFLDEVGELPLTLQAELLRVVQEQTYKRIGSNSWQKTNFRLICATNRDLMEEQKLGHFRSDFYYRIAAWKCHLPPLRERREDILPLVQHFLAKHRPDDPPEIDDAVREYLLTRDYPGNVRELGQVVSRIINHHVGSGPITVGDVPIDERPTTVNALPDWRGNGFQHSIHHALMLGMSLKDIGREAEDIAERIVLEEEQGNLQRAAQRLGVTDRALQLRRAARKQQGNGKEISH